VATDSFIKQCVDRDCVGTWYGDYEPYHDFLYQADTCCKNLGPPRMKQLCLYTEKGISFSLYESQGWRCITQAPRWEMVRMEWRIGMRFLTIFRRRKFRGMGMGLGFFFLIVRGKDVRMDCRTYLFHQKLTRVPSRAE